MQEPLLNLARYTIFTYSSLPFALFPAELNVTFLVCVANQLELGISCLGIKKIDSSGKVTLWLLVDM